MAKTVMSRVEYDARMAASRILFQNATSKYGVDPSPLNRAIMKQVVAEHDAYVDGVPKFDGAIVMVDLPERSSPLIEATENFAQSLKP